MRSKALLILPLAWLAAACASSNPTPSTSTHAATSAPASSGTGGSSVMLGTRTLGGVGTILVDAQGRTLYTFAPDKGQKVTCTGSCATYWPPLKISAGRAGVSSGIQASMVGSDPNPSGGRVVTYNGWPLYTYVADQSAGTDHGQGINSSGGLWYVISPSGAVITKKSSSSSSNSSSGGYGGAY
jgi:predicted lipoprotein with Yx(FWY)xxD motif